MATPQPVDARTQPWRETPGGDLVALGRPVRQALHLVRHNPAQGRVLSCSAARNLARICAINDAP